MNYTLNPYVGCRHECFLGVADGSFDHIHGKLSRSVALDARVKKIAAQYDFGYQE